MSLRVFEGFRLGLTQTTNRALQPHKIARSLSFQVKKVEGFSYLCSENKDADQLRGNRAADLRHCKFYIYAKMQVFS